MGSTYRVNHVRLVDTRYGEKQVWTMEDIFNGDVRDIWAPKALTQYSCDSAGEEDMETISHVKCKHNMCLKFNQFNQKNIKCGCVVNESHIKCMNFEYVSVTTGKGDVKHYTFIMQKEKALYIQSREREAFEAATLQRT